MLFEEIAGGGGVPDADVEVGVVFTTEIWCIRPNVGDLGDVEMVVVEVWEEDEVDIRRNGGLHGGLAGDGRGEVVFDGLVLTERCDQFRRVVRWKVVPCDVDGVQIALVEKLAASEVYDVEEQENRKELYKTWVAHHGSELNEVKQYGDRSKRLKTDKS